MSICYQCEKEVPYLFADCRGSCCTQFTRDEIEGNDYPEWDELLDLTEGEEIKAELKRRLYSAIETKSDEIERLTALNRQWWFSSDALALRVLGQDRYDNSAAQANPLELVEQYIAELEAIVKEIKDQRNREA